MTGHAGQVRAVVTGTGSLEIKWPLNPPTTSRRPEGDGGSSEGGRDLPDMAPNQNFVKRILIEGDS